MIFPVLLTLAATALTSSAAPTAVPAFDLDAGLARAAESDRIMQEFLNEAINQTSNSTVSLFSRRDANGCTNTFHSFSNNQGQPGYTDFIGNTAAGPTGYRMFSDPETESRMRYAFTFNDGSASFTNIWVNMRGAPDSGRNSYAILREPICVSDPGNNSNCDEIDIVEMYGGGNSEAEFTYYKGNGGGPGGPDRRDHRAFPNTQGDAFGHNFFTYKVYLERGNMIKSTIARADGLELDTQSYTDSVPTNPLNLFLGIYPCHFSPGDSVGYCGENYQGGSWMEIGFIFYQTC